MCKHLEMPSLLITKLTIFLCFVHWQSVEWYNRPDSGSSTISRGCKVSRCPSLHGRV